GRVPALVLEERRRGHEPAGAGVLELVGHVLPGREGIEGGDDGAERGGRVVGDDELGAVGGTEGEHVALGHAGAGQPRGGALDDLGQLAVAEGAAGGAVDDRRPVAPGPGLAEYELGDGDRGQLDAGVGAADDYGSFPAGAADGAVSWCPLGPWRRYRIHFRVSCSRIVFLWAGADRRTNPLMGNGKGVALEFLGGACGLLGVAAVVADQ